MAPVPVLTTSGKKIALEAPSTWTPLEDSASLHLVPLGSFQGAVSAFICCGSPLAVVEDRNQRRGLVSKLSICCSVCGKSFAITDLYQKRDLEPNIKSVLSMNHRQGDGWPGDFLWHDGHVASSLLKSVHHSKPEVVCCLR